MRGDSVAGGTASVPRGRSRVYLAALSVLALVLVASSCAGARDEGGGAPDSAPRDVVVESGGQPELGGELVYGLVAETNSWDPGSAQWAPSGRTVAAAIFDTLTAWNADGQAVPFLAESVRPDETLTVWDITLRRGVTFHDGAAVDAEAVAASLDHVRAAPTVGAAADRLESVEVVDQRTVRVTFSEPFAIFPELLAGQLGTVMAPSMIASGTEGARRPVGSGPFRFVEWVPDNHLSVERNDDYWREDLPYLDGIEFRVIPDVTTRLGALAVGELGMAEISEQGAVERVLDDAAGGSFQAISNLGEGEGGKNLVLFNTQAPPLDDVRVRRAVAHAIDTEAVSQVVTGGVSPPASSIFSPNSPFFDDSAYPSFDPDAARRLVEEYEGEVGPISFTVLSPPDPAISVIAAQVQAMLDEVGIDVAIEVRDQAGLIVSAATGDYEAALFRLWGQPSPETTFFILDEQALEPTGISLNLPRIVDDDIQAALDVLLTTRDAAAKEQAYADLQDAMGAVVPMAFLLRTTAVVAADDAVRGFDAWTLPDGGDGLVLNESVPTLAQVWIEP